MRGLDFATIHSIDQPPNSELQKLPGGRQRASAAANSSFGPAPLLGESLPPHLRAEKANQTEPQMGVAHRKTQTEAVNQRAKARFLVEKIGSIPKCVLWVSQTAQCLASPMVSPQRSTRLEALRVSGLPKGRAKYNLMPSCITHNPPAERLCGDRPAITAAPALAQSIAGLTDKQSAVFERKCD